MQQPLDKLLFASPYDHVELLGCAFARGRRAYPLGLALHLSGGAAFGALYARGAPALPLPPAARGMLAALGEHLLSWTALARLCDRLHPAREVLPPLSGNHRAFAQALWRHALFGVVLGLLEGRLNALGGKPYEAAMDYSRNGHGHLEGVLAVGGAPRRDR